ncbi:hypothetical protein NPIL_100061 [Nephila pilipes]|uniref:Uncharacterized protein n=1 Tax=Nephila pilipes TaxID=299642 RepID=A0A8X6NPU9_NEPPI|nr:hypothetical protein NPIL_100061 [Nephila pilipes]
MALHRILAIVALFLVFSEKAESAFSLSSAVGGFQNEVASFFSNLAKQIGNDTSLNLDNPKNKMAVLYFVNGTRKTIKDATSAIHKLFNGARSQIQKAIEAAEKGENPEKALVQGFKNELKSAEGGVKSVANNIKNDLPQTTTASS